MLGKVSKDIESDEKPGKMFTKSLKDIRTMQERDSYVFGLIY